MRRLAVVLGAGVMAVVGAGSGGMAQATPPRAAPAGPAAPIAQDYAFPTGAGILFFHVRPDKTADFESVASRIGAALDQTQDLARRQQAAGWRIYKSVERAPDAVIYLFFFDPAVSGADYDPVRLLGDTAPAEANALYTRLKESLIRVERMGLTKMR